MWGTAMKLAPLCAVLISCALAVIVPSSAQFTPPQFSVTEALRYLDSLSKTYLERLTTARESGNTYPTESDYQAMRSGVDQLVAWLNQRQEDRALNKPTLQEQQSVALFNAALQCINCTKIADRAVAKEFPAKLSELKAILIARLIMIRTVIPTGGRMNNDTLLQLETQIYYLRTIVTAYIGTTA
jgi:hypothetical protein